MVSDRSTVSSLDQRLAWGRMYKAGSRKGALVMPGATQDRDWWFALDSLGGAELRTLTDAWGFPIATSGTLGMWGNSTQRGQMSTLRTNAQAGPFASGKVHLLGVSAGGLAACNWAKANPTLVQSIVLLIPVVDPQATYDANRESFAASISAAYGGRPPDSETPRKYAADLAGIPICVFYSTTDTVTTEAETLAFATAAKAEARSMGAVGHFWGPPWHGNAAARFLYEHD